MSEDRAPRVWGYGRASTKKQVESPETQKDLIKAYATFQKLGDVTYFIDAAKSGKIPWQERDAGKELFKQVRAGDHVIITKLDRAFRRLADCVIVLEKFERMGIKLHITNLMGGAIDLSSPMGRFLIHILAAFAELERAFISERTKDGLSKRKRKNVAHTRHPGYGYVWKKTWIDGKRVKIRERCDDEREVMRSIAQWRMQNNPLSWDEIYQHLAFTLQLKTKDGGVWDINRIRRACKAEFLLQLQEQRGNR
jgi:DNA invertase Pin-like site-specific DNA recombinase